MKRQITIVWIIFSQLIFHFAIAQNTQLKFNPVTLPNGKSLGKIRNICQDNHGYIWLAGEEPGKCVYRFDGNNFITYRHDDADTNSLGGTGITSVYADNRGMIWIGLTTGLDKLNPETGIFKHYRHTNDPASLSGGVQAIAEDKKGRLWVGGAGLDMLDEKTGKFIHYRNIPGNNKSLSCNVVVSLFVDTDDVLWVGTGYPWSNQDPNDGGLNRLEPDGTFTRFMHDPKDPTSLISNKIAAIFEDSKGVFWIGTSGDGLYTMDRKTGHLQRYPYDPKNPEELSIPALNRGDVNDKITFINEDSTGVIWIGTLASGINRYDTVTKKVTHYNTSNGYPDSTSWNAFTSRDGEVWITTQNNTLYRTNPFRASIPMLHTGNKTINFLEDKEGNLWVANFGGGLLKYDQNYKLIQQFKHDASDSFSLPGADNNVGPLLLDQSGMLWVGTTTGVRILNTTTNRFSRLVDNGNLKDSTGSGFANIYQDKQGILWFGRWSLGLISYDPATKAFKHYFSGEDTTSIGSNFINSILEDRSGNFWVGGIDGIGRLDRKTGRCRRFLQNTFITNIYEDSNGSLWLGTEKGLYRYDSKADNFYAFLDPQSEINLLTVGGIVEDANKKIWLVSPSVIIRLDPVTKSTFLFDSSFGINDNSLAAWGSSYITRKGHLLINSDNGFYNFAPEELSTKDDLKIIATNLFINNQEVHGEGNLVKNDLEAMTDLDLQYNQNNVGINFSAIDYREPELVKYFTKLENYDNIWREVKGDKSAYYFNIPPGKYIFRIKAFNRNGTEAQKAITILINPPWWKTWWAYTLYGLLALVLMFTIYRIQKQRIIRRERQKAQQFELEQAKEIEKAYHELRSTQALLIQSEKMASLGELTAGIAHEIQNPLNFVNNFSEVNTELIAEMKEEIDKGNTKEVKSIADDIAENQQKISHHGKRADAIVKGMLQHSRTSSGVKEPTNINALADEYFRLAYHGLRAKDKSFNASMKTDYDERLVKINIIPQDIGRVLLNLITNAFYAVNEKSNSLDSMSQADIKYEPTVTVTTKSIKYPPTSKNSGVSISVRDNGNGVPQNVLDKIFQPFFTTKPAGEGTGLGLSLSYDIIKAHGGEIKLETHEGKGAEFIILLPVE